jgi:hypothetical protein
VAIFVPLTCICLSRLEDGDRYGLLAVVVLLVLALSASRFRFPIRPHLVSYFGMSLLLWLWEVRPRRLLLWVAGIAVFWANCHAGVIFGLGLCFMFLLDALLARDSDRARIAAAGTGVFFAASLLNPFHIYPYLFSFIHLNVDRALPSVSEFRAFSLASDGWTFPLLAVLALAAFPGAIRRGEYLFPLAASGFLLLSLFAVREIPAFVLVALPGVVGFARRVLEALHTREEGNKKAVLALLILTGAAVLLVPADWSRYGAHLKFGSGVNSALLPEGAVRAVRSAGLTGRMYNDYAQGGYLIWKLFPEYGVFQDGRATAYPPEFFREVHGTDTPLDPHRLEEIMARYDIRFAVVRRNPFSGDPGVAPLFEALGWPLIHLDGACLVFVRPGTAGEERSFGLVTAAAGPELLFRLGRENPGLMERELNRIEPSRLLVPMDAFRFAAAAHGAGLTRVMERFLVRMWEMEDGNADPEYVARVLGRLEASQ